MAIVASIIAVDTVNTNGVRWIREDHTDDQNIVHESWYAPQKGVDINAHMADVAADLSKTLAEAENASAQKDALAKKIGASLDGLSAKELAGLGMDQDAVDRLKAGETDSVAVATAIEARA